jgi:hypothetical protein
MRHTVLAEIFRDILVTHIGKYLRLQIKFPHWQISYTEVVHGKGKLPAPSELGCSKGKAPMDLPSSSGARTAVQGVAVLPWSFRKKLVGKGVSWWMPAAPPLVARCPRLLSSLIPRRMTGSWSFLAANGAALPCRCSHPSCLGGRSR